MQLQRRGMKMHNLKNKEPAEPALDPAGLAPWPHCWPLAQGQMACLVAELLMLQQGRGSCGAGWGSWSKRDGSSGMSGVRVSGDGGHGPPQPPQRRQYGTVARGWGTGGLPIHWASSLCQAVCHVQWLSQDSNQLVLDLLVDDMGEIF